MFDGSFEELWELILEFAKNLWRCFCIFIKTVIFWSITLLPLIICFTLLVLQENFLWFIAGIVLEIIWAVIFINSDR